MTYLNFAPEITKTVDGVEYVAIVCWKCGGRGYLPGYEFSDNARCWGECHSRPGPIGWRSREDYEKVLARREKDRKRAAEKAERERLARVAERNRAREEFRSAHPDLVEALQRYEGHSSFLRDLADRLDEDGSLTDAQVEAGSKALQAEAEREANEEDVPEGRQEIVGTVVSLKDYEDTFSPYGGTVWKMVVDAGSFRLFGAVPKAIVRDVEKGARVRFTATLQPKETGFGFYKRPAKAEVLAD